MAGNQPRDFFGPEVAERYDERPRGDEAETVDFLHQLAGAGPVLELAIGTGRIALPLAQRGIAIEGIDLSPAMVARLRAKPGGDRIPVTMGDFADVAVTGPYRLVYVLFNTIFNLFTQDDQVRCFENVAAHLTDDGAFVVEAVVPAYLYQLRELQHVDAELVEADEVRLDVGRYDPVTQLLHESHVHLTAHGVRLHPIVLRCAWPSELDLMARIAGLRLHERWGGWRNEPFDAASTRHVSVYQRP
ncbi:MAG: class I SAM-dependent DNA methyltransferase [Ilumatobacteraceae bacterium]